MSIVKDLRKLRVPQRSSMNKFGFLFPLLFQWLEPLLWQSFDARGLMLYFLILVRSFYFKCHLLCVRHTEFRVSFILAIGYKLSIFLISVWYYSLTFKQHWHWKEHMNQHKENNVTEHWGFFCNSKRIFPRPNWIREGQFWEICSLPGEFSRSTM